MTETKPQFTTLLANRTLGRLERMRILSARRFTSKRRGEHLSGRGGSSIEFSDYRDYTPGDDTRFVDWNIFARLHRPYLKLFHQEEEMHLVLVVDASASMRFESKLRRALEAAAAFGVMGIMTGEPVSAWVLHGLEEDPVCLGPVRGRGSLRKMFHFLEGVEAGGDCPLETGIEALVKHHRGRGVAVVLSDFLTTGDLGRAVGALSHAGLETFGLQILGPAEIDPRVSDAVRFLDCETGDGLDITASPRLLEFYQSYRAGHARNIATLLKQRSGRFLSLSAADDLDEVLFEVLPRKGWVR